jgi:hypothetical protein
MLQKKRIRRTEGWKLAKLLEDLTDAGKLDWTIRGADRDGNALYFDAQIGTKQFSLGMNLPNQPFVVLRTNYKTNVDICPCQLMGLLASAHMVVEAKEMTAAQKKAEERELELYRIRSRVLRMMSGEEEEE